AAASTTEAAARRERAILARLRGDDHSGTAWKHSRVIWRAGELRLRAAEPLLWPFLPSESGPRAAETPSLPGPPGPWRISAPWSDTAIASDDRVQESWGSWGAWPPQAWAGGAPEFLGYSAAWALGRCGS